MYTGMMIQLSQIRHQNFSGETVTNVRQFHICKYVSNNTRLITGVIVVFKAPLVHSTIMEKDNVIDRHRYALLYKSIVGWYNMPVYIAG